MAFCSDCGGKLDEGVRFCSKCGVSVKNSNEDSNEEGKAVIAPDAEEKAVAQVITEPVVQAPSIRYVERMDPDNTEKKSFFTKKPVILSCIIVMAVIIISLVIAGVFQYRKFTEEAAVFAEEVNKLTDEVSTLTESVDYWYFEVRDLSAVYPIIIHSIDFANTREDGTYIVQPGGRLDSSGMRYLTTEITYESFWGIDYRIPLRITIYDESGRRSQMGNNNYTYAREITIDNYTGTIGLGGWGNSTTSTYSRGNYRVEIWYNDVSLGSKTVTIY